MSQLETDPGPLYYEIVWKGYTDNDENNTWEHESNVNESVLSPSRGSESGAHSH